MSKLAFVTALRSVTFLCVRPLVARITDFFQRSRYKGQVAYISPGQVMHWIPVSGPHRLRSVAKIEIMERAELPTR